MNNFAARDCSAAAYDEGHNTDIMLFLEKNRVIASCAMLITCLLAGYKGSDPVRPVFPDVTCGTGFRLCASGLSSVSYFICGVQASCRDAGIMCL